MSFHELPLPPHYEPEKIGKVWRVAYEARAVAARNWAKENGIQPAAHDALKVCLLAVDVQNTFCLPDFELFVGGRSGTGAIDDSRRLCEFIYHHLGLITEICPTMDTHQAIQIFHAIFFVNDQGEHPQPYTLISEDDITRGVWKFNPAASKSLGISVEKGQRFVEHYTRRLKQSGRYALTVWPYHAMLGGIGHALVPAVEEAIFFHAVARCAQPDIQLKGSNPLTENYSVLSPEVVEDEQGDKIAARNKALIEKLLAADAVIIAGQAKSHCVAWTIEDLLGEIERVDAALAKKVYLLEDCTSPVVVPGAIDYTEQANDAFDRFAAAGMHIVRSTDPISEWPGFGTKV